MSNLLNASLDYQRNKASADGTFALLIASIGGVIGFFTLGKTAFNKGKPCYLPEFLCGMNPMIYMVTFIALVIGILLHLGSFIISKQVTSIMTVAEINKKQKLMKNMTTAGHILLIPLYLCILFLALYIGVGIAGGTRF
jgi:hypothetical protein